MAIGRYTCGAIGRDTWFGWSIVGGVASAPITNSSFQESIVAGVVWRIPRLRWVTSHEYLAGSHRHYAGDLGNHLIRIGLVALVAISLKMHGAWVRLKDSTLEGRIAYYDTETKQVWVVWETGKYTLHGQPHKMKQPSASGQSPATLTYLSRYEHKPWIAERS